ncbi:MAG: hypothetical protein KGQ37_10755 [Hyphomicrobiales bacterium]|nr:hypothetical protein [Hyphomicrobiales bacterium]
MGRYFMAKPKLSLERIKRSFRRRLNAMPADFREDGFAIKSKSLDFLDDPRFKAAWAAIVSPGVV